MAEPITFKVAGVPQTKGSAKAFYRPGMKAPVVTNDNRKNKPWQAGVSAAAAEAFRGRPVIQNTVRLELRFYMPRPKSHFGTGRNANILKPSAPTAHDKKPDLDKLVRSVKDGLSKIAYQDDALVSALFATKQYDSGEGVGVEITITEY